MFGGRRRCSKPSLVPSSSMGCNPSKLKEEDAAAASGGAGDASAAASSTAKWPFRRRIEELRRSKDGMKVIRKDSLFSATELLLLPEERDTSSDAEPPAPDTSIAFDAAGESPEAIRKMEKEDDTKKKGPAAAAAVTALVVEEESEEAAEASTLSTAPAVDLGRWRDLPGSPSFRIYYVERDSDDEGSLKVPAFRMNNMTRNKGNAERIIVEEESTEEKRHEREVSGGESSNSGEELLEQKKQKQKKKTTKKKVKVEGRRKMKALWKSPSRMYRLLDVRNCYHVQNAGEAAAGGGSAGDEASSSPPPGNSAAAAADGHI